MYANFACSLQAGAIAVLFALGATTAGGQPIPPEFLVNQTTTGHQSDPVIGHHSNGDFIVGWMSGTTMYVRKFAGGGAPLGGEIALPVTPDGFDHVSGVALGSAGTFAVAWGRSSMGGLASSAHGRLFASDGTPLSDEAYLGGFGEGVQVRPRVAMGPDGAYVTAYSDQVGWAPPPLPSFLPLSDIFCRRFGANGVPLGIAIPLGDQRMNEGGVDISMNATGAFAVAWIGDDFGDANTAVFVRAYDSVGNPIAAVQTVATPSSARHAGVAMAGDGTFVVVWHEGPINSTQSMVMARRYDAASLPSGPAVRVDDAMQAYYGEPSVCVGPTGKFTIAWTTSDLQNSFQNPNVVERRYASDMAPLGGPYRMNVQTAGNQLSPAVTSLADGGFVAVWESAGQDGDGTGVIGRLFPASLVGVEISDLEVFATADRVRLTWRLEPDAARNLVAVRVERAENVAGPFGERATLLPESRAPMSFAETGVDAGRTYWYRLALIGRSTGVTYSRLVWVTAGPAASAGAGLAVVAGAGGGSVELRYRIPRATRASLVIYDVTGRRVRSIHDGAREPGEYVHSWDRRDLAGTRVARGTYFVRLNTGDQSLAKKFVLVRE